MDLLVQEVMNVAVCNESQDCKNRSHMRTARTSFCSSCDKQMESWREV